MKIQPNFYVKTQSSDTPVTSDAMQQYVESIKTVLEGINPGEIEDGEEEISKLKDSLNNAISKINADKNYNIELEEVK